MQFDADARPIGDAFVAYVYPYPAYAQPERVRIRPNGGYRLDRDTSAA